MVNLSEVVGFRPLIPKQDDGALLLRLVNSVVEAVESMSRLIRYLYSDLPYIP